MSADFLALPLLVVLLAMYYSATSRSRRHFSSALASLGLSSAKEFVLFFIHTILFGLLLTLTFLFLALDLVEVPRYFYASPAVALLLSGLIHFYCTFRAGNQTHT